MVSNFVIIDNVKKYSDFWCSLRSANQDNFQSDINIMIKMQEACEKKLYAIQQEKDRLYKLMQLLSNEEITSNEWFSKFRLYARDD